MKLRLVIHGRDLMLGSWTMSVAAIAITLPLGSGAVSAARSGPPNIVYIISDDQGWKDVGFHGSDIKTPNLDALAVSGARLEQFYTQPMCTPTRAALMTGRYPFRYGLQTAYPVSPHLWPCRPTNGSCRRR